MLADWANAIFDVLPKFFEVRSGSEIVPALHFSLEAFWQRVLGCDSDILCASPGPLVSALVAA
jgi:hypothetical protein